MSRGGSCGEGVGVSGGAEGGEGGGIVHHDKMETARYTTNGGIRK